MTAEPAPVTGSAVPTCFMTSRQRDPPVFAGLHGEDVEDWRDIYDRVSAFNRWDDCANRLNAGFYLSDLDEKWIRNHERTVPDWASFTTLLRHIFGSSAARSEGAKKTLESHAQKAYETYTSYIEDVLALCCRVDRDMTEETGCVTS